MTPLIGRNLSGRMNAMCRRLGRPACRSDRCTPVGLSIRVVSCLTVAAIWWPTMIAEAQTAFAPTKVRLLRGDEPVQVAPVTVLPAALVLPPGAVQRFTAAATGTGAGSRTTWTATGGVVTADGTYTAGTTGGQFRVTATIDGGTVSGFAQVAVVAPPPGVRYLSDRSWASMTNGWGPVEKDRSNGDSSVGDGRPLLLNGVTYAKGLGVHGLSEIRYALNGGCSAFNAVIGIDDETAGTGTVVFQVWADAVKVYESAVMSGTMAGRMINVPVVGALEMALVVTDGGDGNISDHGDWADAKMTCPVDATAPTTTAVTPAPGATNLPTDSNITITFSEPMDPATLNTRTIFLVPQAPK